MTRFRSVGLRGTRASTVSRPGTFPRSLPDHAGHGGNAGMRHWIGLSVRSDMASTPVIKPDGRPLPRIHDD